MYQAGNKNLSPGAASILTRGHESAEKKPERAALSAEAVRTLTGRLTSEAAPGPTAFGQRCMGP